MHKPLKIFIVGPGFPLRGGPARFNENLCAALIRAGHRAEIISYSLQYPSFLFPGTSQLEENGKPPAGIAIRALISTVNPLSWLRTARLIRRERPDFILFRYWLPFFGPALGTIARLVRRQTKVLALTDNVLPHEKRMGDKILTRYFINGCHGFIAMSKTVLADISKFTSNPHKAYAPHPMYETYGPAVGMSEARQRLGLSVNARIVLFFGLVRHYKGLDILLEAMADSRVREEKVVLLIAGEFYDQKEKYLSLIRPLGDRVILHDRFIPDDQVRDYFCAANLVAQTYRNATNSGVTMVGYYYGRPMLVTRVGGLQEIVPEGCGYVTDCSPPAIAACMLDFFANSREAGFSANVLAERKKYEWDHFINTLLNLYNSC